MEQYVLGADIGSGSVKLTLLSDKGLIKGTSGCEYPTFYPQVGYSEQDAEDWCTAFKNALKKLLLETGVNKSQIKAIAPDAATHTAVLLSEDKRPLRNAILWTDQRSRSQVKYLKDNYSDIIKSQVLNEPTTVWTLPQMLWLRMEEPEVYGKIRYLLFAKDYLRFRLTGEMVTDRIDAMGSMFYDAVKEEWSKELCEAGGIQKEWLPGLLGPMDIAGEVTQEAAEEFGLEAGTKVLAGSTDTVMEVFAAGSVEPGNTTVKLATAGRICVITEKPVDSPYVFNYRHILPGMWYPGTGTSSCANSYRWYRDNLGNEDYEILNRGAEKVSPGSDGLMFHPYINGELTPYNDPLLKGSFTCISARHTKAHFTRATLEGVAFSLRDCLNTVRGLGMEPGRVRIIGGGAKGLLWRQIVADTLELHLEKAEVDDSSFGSAMLAAVGIGWFSSCREAAEKCIRVASCTDPIADNVKIYGELFTRYKKIHDVLAPIYDEMGKQ